MKWQDVYKLPLNLDEWSDNYAWCMGNGTYSWKGLYADDTRILFLTGVLRSEGVEFKEG